jgi:hypothetical protein
MGPIRNPSYGNSGRFLHDPPAHFHPGLLRAWEGKKAYCRVLR